MAIPCHIGTRTDVAAVWQLAMTASGQYASVVRADAEALGVADFVRDVAARLRSAGTGTDADLRAAWEGRSGPGDDGAALAVQLLGNAPDQDGAMAAIREVWSTSADWTSRALAGAWAIAPGTSGLLWFVASPEAAARVVWLHERGEPWPGPFELGLAEDTFEALRRSHPRVIDRLDVRGLAPSPGPDESADELRELKARAEAALSATLESRDPVQEGQALSAAEAFLAAVLSRRERTAGRFVLNGDPGFAFGGQPCRVDLLARGSRVALEIDGPHHFRDDAAFRRDRRKDVLLQRHGFAVVRFLAWDVVTRLEEILEAVDATLDWKEGVGR